jgi:hypothetical protein
MGTDSLAIVHDLVELCFILDSQMSDVGSNLLVFALIFSCQVFLNSALFLEDQGSDL